MNGHEISLAEISAHHPKEMMFSIMEVLVDVACGPNLHLREHYRLRIYRAIRQKLTDKGIR